MNDSGTRFEWLRQRYAQSLADKHATLAEAWADSVAAPTDEHARRRLQQQLHRLCGSAHAYGYAQLGDEACSTEGLMRAWESAPPALRDEPAALLQRLARPVAAVLAGLAPSDDSGGDPTDASASTPMRILLVADDPGASARLRADLAARGCRTRSEQSVDLLWQTMTLWPCHAAVVALRDAAAVDAIATVRRERRFARVALVAIADEGDSALSRAALEAGADAVVAGSKPLFDVVRECVGRADRSGPHAFASPA